MKRLIYIITVACILLAGCGEQKRIFDESAAARIQKAVDEVSGILLDSPNGWMLQYFPQLDTYGGYSLYVKFNDDMTANIQLLEEVEGIPEEMRNTTGLYQVKAEQSVVLSFDTGSNALHYFMDGTSGMDLLSDYEFLPKEWEKDHILLKGKRFGQYADLTVFPVGETVDSYRGQIDQSIVNLEYIGYKLNVKGKTYRVMPVYDQRHLAYVNEEDAIERIPYIYTPTGIKFYLPVTLNGVEFSELDYDDSQGKFTNEQGDAALEKFIPTNCALLADERLAWYFSAKDGMLSDKFRVEWNKQSNASFTPTLLYFCKDDKSAPELYTESTWSNGTAEPIRLKLTLEQIADNKINMKYKSVSGGPYTFMSARYPEIIQTFFALSRPDIPSGQSELVPIDFEKAAYDPGYNGRTYVISLDDPFNPKTLTLTAEDDPAYWFKLAVVKTNVQ